MWLESPKKPGMLPEEAMEGLAHHAEREMFGKETHQSAATPVAFNSVLLYLT